MRKTVLSLLFSLLCLSVYGASLEPAFQLGEKQYPKLDRLLPDVARYMAFNKDSTKLIAKGMEGTLIVWDIQSRQKQEIGNIQAKRLLAYAAGTDQLLIQKSNDVTILNLRSGDETIITKGGYESGGLSFDATSVVLSQGDNTFGFWQLGKERSKFVKTIQTALPVRNRLTLSKDSQYIAAAEGTYRDGEGHRTIIEVWDTNDVERPMRVFDTGEISGIWNLVFSDNGKRLAVDTQHKAKSGIRVWDVKTGAQLFYKSGFEAYWTRALAFAPHNKVHTTEYLAAGDEKGHLRIWKIDDGDTVIWETYPTGIQTLAFSPNSEYLAVALWDATIQILKWEINEQ